MSKIDTTLQKELNNSQRIFGLDILRAIAIIFVLCSHTLRLFLGVDPNDMSLYMFFGYYGVEFFFVLSGFLIGGILIKKVNENTVFTFSELKQFWIRRWFRTIPNYYFMLFVTIIAWGMAYGFQIFNDSYYIRFLFFVQNFFVFENDFFRIAWSLCIEEWFYLLFPLVLFVLSYIVKSKYNQLLYTILFFIISATIARIIVAADYNLGWDPEIRRSVPLRIDGIVIGVLAAFIKHYHLAVWKKAQEYYLAGVLLLLLSFYIFYAREILDTHILLSKTLLFNLTGLAIAALLPIFYNITFGQNTGIGKFISVISIVSYSLYLNHSLILWLIEPQRFPSIVTFVSVWLLSIAVSIVQYVYLEKPMTQLREKYSKNQ